MSIRFVSIPNNTTTEVYSWPLSFGRSNTVRVDISTGSSACCFDLTILHDSLGIGHTITNSMGDSVLHSLSVIESPTNILSVNITNNESTSSLSVYITEILNTGLDNCVFI